MKRPSLYQDSRLWVLLGLGLLLIIHHVWGYYGHYGFDDIVGYGYYAKQWADGQAFYLNEDFFSYRWGFIAPTSLFYALFGINDHVSALFPTLIYLATALLVMRVMRLEKSGVAVLAALLYGLDNWTLYYSDKLMADTSVALAVLLAFSAIARERFEASQSVQNALLLTASVFWGYLSKQSILLLFPVFLILLVMDVAKGRHRRFWGYTVLACTTVGMAYLAWIYALTGNPLERFLAVNQGVVDNLGAGRSFAFCNYSIQESSVLYYRIFAEMGLKFINSGMALSLFLALPALLAQRWTSFWQAQSFTAYWSFVLLLSLISSNFMTTSYEAYLPICPDIRHFLMLVPLAAVVAAPSVASFAKTKEKGRYFLLSFGIAALLGNVFTTGNMRWLYLGIFGLVLIRLLLPNKPYSQWLFVIGLLGVLTIPVLSAMRTTMKESSYVEQRGLIYQHFKNAKTPRIVIANQVTCNTAWYLMEYEEHPKTQFYTYDELPHLSFSSEVPVYVLASGDMRYRSGMKYKDLPPIIKGWYSGQFPSGIETLHHSEKVLLLRMHDPQLLLNSINK
ncbi:MAG: ArnT family glycosyltransferase [Aureispira sp.]